MKKWIVLPAFLLPALFVSSQSRTDQLAKAVSNLESDAQMATATIAFYVIDGDSGTVVFEKNGRTGVAPASTQKVITSTTAYEILGQAYHYETALGYRGAIRNGRLDGFFFVKGSGDPTFGSWRYAGTREVQMIEEMRIAVAKSGIKSYRSLAIDTAGWGGETIPDGWIWEDIGNYYGAAANVLNWRENQYDLVFHSASTIASQATLEKTEPKIYDFPISSRVTAAAAGTGDNTNIYFRPNEDGGTVDGTIPVSQEHFVVSGAIPSPSRQFSETLENALAQNGIKRTSSDTRTASDEQNRNVIIYRHVSPSFDSIIYWFLRKSINLYGEALVKTMALKQEGRASTGAGVQVVKDFWKDHGIDPSELHIVDGSGLSPLNRVTAHAQVTALAYAQKQSWFPAFYNALPVYNGMKMKSGSISGSRAFCGYQASKDGHHYIFSLIINNYDGSPSQVVQKMYKVLDELK